MSDSVTTPLPLKIVFAGTPEFSAKHLQALVEAKIHITAVLTRPDKPAGRGLKVLASDVKRLAEEKGLVVHQPKSLRNQEAIDLVMTLNADLIVDVAYGVIIPKEILAIPRFGFINVHPSLLPRWRGPAPIQHALLAGDKDTGVSIMSLDEGVDTGPILLQKTYHMQPNETGASLHDRLAKLGSNALITVLQQLERERELKSTPQEESGACYAPKIEKSMAKIIWFHPAPEIERMIRAFNDWPVAHTTIGGEVVRLWRANPLSNYIGEPPGTIIRIDSTGIDVVTGDGVLRIQEMQFPGGKRLPVADILNSKREFFETHKLFL